MTLLGTVVFLSAVVSAQALAAGAAAFARTAEQVTRRVVQGPRPVLPPRDPTMSAQTGSAVVEGRVIDAITGEPVPRADVTLGGLGGPPTITRSNDQGAFVFADLPAGRFSLHARKVGYTINALPDSMRRASRREGLVSLAAGERKRGVELRLLRASAITGRVVDVHGDPVEYAIVNASRVLRGNRTPEMQHGASTNDLGEYRLAGLQPGAYVVCATPQRRGTFEDTTTPVHTCHPGTTMKGDAVAVVVERSQRVDGIDITLLERDVFTVSGRIVDGNGQGVAMGSLIVVPRTGSGLPTPAARIGPDGTFRVSLVPGTYTLEARYAPPPRDASSGPEEEMGIAFVTVGHEPISGVEVRLGSAGKVTGRVVFEGESPRPASPQQVHISLVSDEAPAPCQRGPSVVTADWFFTAANVFGECSVQAYAGGPWLLKAVYRDGTLLRDGLLAVGPGEHIGDLRVVFTDRPASLSFDVADERGVSTREFVAFVFPAQRERWGTARSMTLTYVPPEPAESLPAGVSSAGPVHQRAPEGRADLPRVIPGEYFVAAVDDANWEDTRDPAFLASLAESAVKVTLAEGEHRTVSLRRTLVSWPR